MKEEAKQEIRDMVLRINQYTMVVRGSEIVLRTPANNRGGSTIWPVGKLNSQEEADAQLTEYRNYYADLIAYLMKAP